MLPVFQALFALCTVPWALAFQPCSDGTCPVKGTSVLQLRSGIAASQRAASESSSHTYRFQGAEITMRGEAGEDNEQQRWIIMVKSGCSSQDLAGLAEHMPAGSEPVYQGHPSEGGLCTFIMQGTRAQVEEELASHNLTGDGVIVESDAPVQATPEVPEEDGQAALLDLRATASWGLDRIDDLVGLDGDYSPPAAARDGAGVHVYVFDTGINTAHTDFGGRAVATLEVLGSRSPYPLECGPSTPGCALDRQGHGTHCAGTVGGTQYGVAKAAQIHSVKVLGDDGSGYTSWGVMATDWVLTKGRRPAVLSMSLGGRGSSPTETASIDRAVARGVAVVVAAGNEGRTSMPDACDYTPAGVASAITVGSTTQQDARSSWSNVGRCVDIFAPGSSIRSASHSSNTASRVLSGTSMACPHVAGAVALILGEDASRSPAQVLAKLLERSISDIISSVGSGSPNELLHVLPGEGEPTPSPTPMTTSTLSPTPGTTSAPPTPAPSPAPCSLCESGYKLRKRRAAWKKARNPDGSKYTCQQAEEKQNSDLAEMSCAEAQAMLQGRCCKEKREKRHRRRSA